MDTLESGLPSIVGSGEDIVRFAFSSREIKGGLVKPNLFLPNPKDQHKETSVFRHGREPKAQLLEIAEEIAEKRGRSVKGAAFLSAGAIYRAGLDCVACEPPARHAGIRGWPWIGGDRVLQKSRQIEKAVILSAAAGEPVII